MNQNKLSKLLLISVDPGFDFLKVVINGTSFKLPFNVEKTDEKQFNNMKVDENFMLYRNGENETWRIGTYARDLIFQNKDVKELEVKMNEFYTEKRFVTEEFAIGVSSAIAKALFNYSQDENNDFSLDNLDEYSIYLVVALPHAIREDYNGPVISSLEGEHSFELTIGTSSPIKFEYKLPSDQIITTSQTIAAIYNETADDEGNLDEEKNFYLSNGPTLVIDGGYYTMGLVPVSVGGSIDNSKTESDSLHAMKNVNIKVADEIKDKRPDAKHYTIEYLANKDDGKLKYLNKTDGNKVVKQEIDIKGIKKEKVKEVCDEFIEHLNNKYNSLLDFNYVLVTGGTGNEYYPHLKKYYVDETQILDADRLILSKNKFNGKDYSVEFAIAIGAYKALCAYVAFKLANN